MGTLTPSLMRERQRHLWVQRGFPDGSTVKNLPANAGDAGLIPGLARSPGEGNGNSLQYSCLENPKDRGACWATVHEEMDMTEQEHLMDFNGDSESSASLDSVSH